MTLVLGVDDSHMGQLRLAWDSWLRHKPSLLRNPVVIFADVSPENFTHLQAIAFVAGNVSIYGWPLSGVNYPPGIGDKWSNPQRHKMLAGFVHVPAYYVQTPYWIKVDLDTLASGNDDWIDPEWFSGNPAIIAHRWGYTKPPGQMLQLDAWCEKWPDVPLWQGTRPLNLRPRQGASILKHERVASFVGIFETEFTRQCSAAAEKCFGKGLLPVPSQDGYLWYMAARTGRKFVRTNMKRRGWVNCNGERRMRIQAEKLAHA